GSESPSPAAYAIVQRASISPASDSPLVPTNEAFSGIVLFYLRRRAVVQPSRLTRRLSSAVAAGAVVRAEFLHAPQPIRLIRPRKFAQVSVHEDLVGHLVRRAHHELDRTVVLHLHLVVVPGEMIDLEGQSVAQ